jgi:hypothetical protein|tara:strand:- start:3421 stop:4368 length:948 start_codon:yes stop_codon:yes gene_type:complete
MADHGKIPRPKTQKEILLSNPAQDTYKNPENGETTGNPNRAFPDRDNRGNQVSFRGDKVKPFSLGLKENDEALFYYLENVIKPTVMQNGVVTKVPVYYGSPERWAQVQKEGYYRDLKGKIMMPVITFKRNSVEKVRNIANKLDANFPNNVQLFEKQYSSKNEYDNFNVINNRIPKKEFYAVVVPDYVVLTYDFIISTYYVEQMNKIVEAMNYASDSYWGNKERFQFRARIDNYQTSTEIVTAGNRLVKTNFQLKLHGYLVPDTIQKELSSIKKFSNSTQIIFNLETVSKFPENDFSSDPRLSIHSNNNPTSFNEK